MMIYINIDELKDSTGKVVEVHPSVSIQIDVNEGYNIFSLRRIEDKMKRLLEDELKECLS